MHDIRLVPLEDGGGGLECHSVLCGFFIDTCTTFKWANLSLNLLRGIQILVEELTGGNLINIFQTSANNSTPPRYSKFFRYSAIIRGRIVTQYSTRGRVEYLIKRAHTQKKLVDWKEVWTVRLCNKPWATWQHTTVTKLWDSPRRWSSSRYPASPKFDIFSFLYYHCFNF